MSEWQEGDGMELTLTAKIQGYPTPEQELAVFEIPSARRPLKCLEPRENRWMTDVNHQGRKARVFRYGGKTLFLVEDRTGIREATERVRRRDRYPSVSWAFYRLRQI